MRSDLLVPDQPVAGAKVRVATVSGPVDLTVPKRSNTGKIMRLRCRGVQSTGGKGDHLLELQVMLPGST
jgi:DnaJ-class molecular chaperone